MFGYKAEVVLKISVRELLAFGKTLKYLLPIQYAKSNMINQIVSIFISS